MGTVDGKIVRIEVIIGVCVCVGGCGWVVDTGVTEGEYRGQG